MRCVDNHFLAVPDAETTNPLGPPSIDFDIATLQRFATTAVECVFFCERKKMYRPVVWIVCVSGLTRLGAKLWQRRAIRVLVQLLVFVGRQVYPTMAEPVESEGEVYRLYCVPCFFWL